MAEVYKTLSTAVIVNRGALAALKGPEMETTLTAIHGAGLPVRVVDNMAQFFSDQSLMEAIGNNSPDLPVIAEFRGVVFDDSEKFVINKMAELLARVSAELTANKPAPVSAWKFAKVPDGWNIEDNIVFLKSTIKRKKGDTGYSIGHKTLEKVWKMASKYWASKSVNDRIEVQAGGYCRTATCYRTGEDGTQRVTIGCQTIKRFELEQVALTMGWEFPETV
jgi:hypothetical protein